MKNDFRFDLQLFADAPVTPPPIDDADAAERVAAFANDSDDFDATFAREQKEALARPIESFASTDEVDEEDPLNATLEAPTMAVKRVETPNERAKRLRAEADAADAESQQAAIAQADVAAPAAGAAPSPTAAGVPAVAASAAVAVPTAAPVALNDDEEIGLTADARWPRKHVVAALQEREGLIAQLRAFQESLGTDANGAVQNWAPLTKKIRETPGMGEFLQKVADTYEPGRAKYLADAMDYYDAKMAERGGSPAAAAPAASIANDPEIVKMRNEVAQLRQEREQSRQQAAMAQIRSEQELLATKYEAIRDPEVMKMVAQRAFQGLQNDPTYTLTRAADELAPYLARLMGSPATAPIAPAPAAVVVPALNGAGGAAPRGTSKPESTKPLQFASGDDAEADWNKARAALGFK